MHPGQNPTILYGDSRNGFHRETRVRRRRRPRPPPHRRRLLAEPKEMRRNRRAKNVVGFAFAEASSCIMFPTTKEEEGPTLSGACVPCSPDSAKTPHCGESGRTVLRQLRTTSGRRRVVGVNYSQVLAQEDVYCLYPQGCREVVSRRTFTSSVY